MSVNDESSASRQFVVSSAARSSKWIKGTRYWQVGYSVFFAVVVVLGLLGVFGRLWGVHLRFPHIGAAVIYGVLVGMMVVGVGIAAYLFWRSRRKYLITVTGDGLTIDRRRGDVYSLVDAQLGLWVDMGVALHLHCGRRARCLLFPNPLLIQQMGSFAFRKKRRLMRTSYSLGTCTV